MSVQVTQLNPPPNFCYLEDSITRCTTPIGRHNISFIQSISISAVLNVSGEVLDENFLVFLDNSRISVKHIFSESRNTIELEEWIKCALELILSTVSCNALASSPRVLLIGNPVHCIDILLIACMRRVQNWSLVSILSEFRILQGPLQKRICYAEQLIEYFDVSIIDLTHQPDFIAIHRLLLCTEKSMWSRLRSNVGSSLEDSRSMTFLFSSPNALLTSESQFTELSIVKEENDD